MQIKQLKALPSTLHGPDELCELQGLLQSNRTGYVKQLTTDCLWRSLRLAAYEGVHWHGQHRIGAAMFLTVMCRMRMSWRHVVMQPSASRGVRKPHLLSADKQGQAHCPQIAELSGTGLG